MSLLMDFCLVQLQGVEGQLWMRAGVRVPLGAKRCLHRALDLPLGAMFLQGQQVSVRGGTAVGRPCPQALPPTRGPCPSESLVACNPREHPRTCSPPTSPSMGLPVPAARTMMLGHPAIIPCPARHMMLLHPPDPSLEVTAAGLAGRHGHLEGTSGPLSLGCTWAQFLMLAGNKGQDVRAVAILDRETEARGSFRLSMGALPFQTRGFKVTLAVILGSGCSISCSDAQGLTSAHLSQIESAPNWAML